MTIYKKCLKCNRGTAFHKCNHCGYDNEKNPEGLSIKKRAVPPPAAVIKPKKEEQIILSKEE